MWGNSVRRCILGLALFSLVWLGVSGGAWAERAVYVAAVEGDTISPVTTAYLDRAIREAESAAAVCLVIKLDTPGGLLEATRNIVKRIMNADLPIVVYVAPRGARAGSAGVFITLAANVAAMAPSTNIGAAHPVSVGGGGGIFKRFKKVFKEKDKEEKGPEQEGEEEHDPMVDKIMHDTVAWVSAIARERGRNVDWAVRSVTESISDSETAALEAGVIDLVADDLTDLLAKLNGRKVKLPQGERVLETGGARLVFVDLSLRERVLRSIAHPNVAYILMLLGFYGLLFEFTHPGIGFPGIGGAICLILAFFAFQVLPTNYAGLALIVLGIVLFIAEAEIVSYGLLTLGGIICMFFGSLILFEAPQEFMQVSLGLVLPLVLGTAAITVLLCGMALRAQRQKVSTGAEGLIGEEGVARSEIAPKGKVFVHGELWKAFSEEPIAEGESVVVVAVDKLKLMVKKK